MQMIEDEEEERKEEVGISEDQVSVHMKMKNPLEMVDVCKFNLPLIARLWFISHFAHLSS